jgi:hypothetical protein
MITSKTKIILDHIYKIKICKALIMIKNIKIIMKNGWARVIMKNLNHQIKPNN